MFVTFTIFAREIGNTSDTYVDLFGLTCPISRCERQDICVNFCDSFQYQSELVRDDNSIPWTCSREVVIPSCVSTGTGKTHEIVFM